MIAILRLSPKLLSSSQLSSTIATHTQPIHFAQLPSRTTLRERLPSADQALVQSREGLQAVPLLPFAWGILRDLPAITAYFKHPITLGRIESFKHQTAKLIH